MMQGQIIKQISNLYTVKVGDMLYGCRARGKFRKDNISPMVGDYVIINTEDNVIESILERKNELDRPVIANVDIALIVTSTKKPNLDLNLLDKLISVITFNDIEPVICFTKLDLLNEVEKENIDNLRKYYEMIGINCVYNTDTAEIKRLLDNNIVVLAGQTGAGKSSLLNRLDDELDIETNEISEALGRGKHTTRHVELYEISDGYIADTPGFSALDLKDMNKEQLRDTFVEFRNYECKFRDCMHHKESKCGVKEALEDKMILQSRYNNYLLFLEEVEK
ncbi:MAG: ribosome small subunit-dependent GTPase A [Firmicutes bacterium]|nr:ribosome small subunit-dependent GTPase A [Bacillota bacterium]